MDKATRYAAYILGFVLLLAAVAVFAQSLSGPSNATDWKVPCGLAIGSVLSLGVGWFMGTGGAPETGCAGSDGSETEGAGMASSCGAHGSNFGQTDAIVLDDGRVLAAGGLTFGVGETKASMVFTPNYANLESGISGAASGTWDFTRDHGGHVTSLSGPTEHHKLIKLEDGRVLLIVGYDQLFQSVKWGRVYRDTPGVQAELFDPDSGVGHHCPTSACPRRAAACPTTSLASPAFTGVTYSKS